MRQRLAGAALAFGCAVAPAFCADAAQLVPVASGLDQPVYVTAPPDDPRLFVVERTGRIVVIDAGVVQPTPFLDIRDRVDTEREGGLTGLVFPPDYAASGRFFVYYTNGVPLVNDRVMQARISSFTAVGDPRTSDLADAASEQPLFALDLPNVMHHGGTIAIRDHWLYLGLGDGGGATSDTGAYDPDDTAQDGGQLLGKMLRFDLTQNEQPQVWSKGFRNPFRFSFDRQTGDLYIGDVGQDSREEIDVESAGSSGGLNYGWDVMEGSICADPSMSKPPCHDPSLVPPVYEYEHEVDGCSAVTGGFVYRGTQVPALVGEYLFSDFCHPQIWSLRWEAGSGLVGLPVDRSAELVPPGATLSHIAGFGEDADGELYVTAIGDFSSTGGSVYRVPEPLATPSAAVAAVALLSLRARSGS